MRRYTQRHGRLAAIGVLATAACEDVFHDGGLAYGPARAAVSGRVRDSTDALLTNVKVTAYLLTYDQADLSCVPKPGASVYDPLLFGTSGLDLRGRYAITVGGRSESPFCVRVVAETTGDETPRRRAEQAVLVRPSYTRGSAVPRDTVFADLVLR